MFIPMYIIFLSIFWVTIISFMVWLYSNSEDDFGFGAFVSIIVFIFGLISTAMFFIGKYFFGG